MKRPELLEVLDDLATALTIVPVAALEPVIASCEIALRDAVASRNGSTRDARVLALAYSAEADPATQPAPGTITAALQPAYERLF